jgi:hypothetical protein
MESMPNQTMQALSTKFASLEPLLDERARRLWAAVEARAIGRGGITCVSEATGPGRLHHKEPFQNNVSKTLPRGLAASHCREPQPFRHRPNMIR